MLVGHLGHGRVERAQLLRDLALVVRALHALGIVELEARLHGRQHGLNGLPALEGLDQLVQRGHAVGACHQLLALLGHLFRGQGATADLLLDRRLLGVQLGLVKRCEGGLVVARLEQAVDAAERLAQRLDLGADDRVGVRLRVGGQARQRGVLEGGETGAAGLDVVG